ncbi:hypothetical protein F4X73_12215 [Candidatus Poribacteria bacterium]|nr:hypothetical protein [Candidatus Poribacteria bacterium]MYB65447.1 hypothetical protein [Candidatus Poribacteria bacterium]
MLSRFYTQTRIGMMLLFVSMLIFTPILSEAHETEFPSKKLDGIFPEAKKFVKRNVVLTNDKITSIEKELGSKLRKEDLKPIFYIAISGEKKPLGLVLFVDVQGPSGVMDGGVGLNMKGKVVKVEVYDHKESEAIASEKFLKQFIDKGIDDNFQVGKDITAVEGQEEASKAVALMPKKTLVMSYALFLKRKPKPDDDTKPEPEETPEELPEVEDLRELMTLMVDDYYVIVDYFDEDEGKEDAVAAAKRLALYAKLIPDFEPPKNSDKTEEYVNVQEKFTKTVTEFATALDKNGITDETRKKWDEIVTFVNQVHTRFTEEGIDLDAY